MISEGKCESYAEFIGRLISYGVKLFMQVGMQVGKLALISLAFLMKED